MANVRSSTDPLGMTCPITRRDFVNGVLAGSGALFATGCGPGADAGPFAPSGSPWTGYGGIGDYARANGNTEAVVQAAHGIRDGRYPDPADTAIEERADLVIVGGGFSGMTAAYEFSKRHRQGQTCLLLENHPVMGGEARQNEFLVGGRRLTAPQGSNGALVIDASYVKGGFDNGRYDLYADYYRELGLPARYDREPLAGGAERYAIPIYHFAPMAPASERGYATGYHFRGKGWARDPVRNAFAGTPWPPAVRRELDDFVHNRRDAHVAANGGDAWLDSISYHDLLDRLNYGDRVKSYIDPYIAVADFGVCGNAISALAAKELALPGTIAPSRPDPAADSYRASDEGVVSFPGGNAAILRMMVARMLPGAIGGDGGLAATAAAPIDFARLDRPGAPLRLRLGATAIDVRHEGDPAGADHAIVTYLRDGKARRVRAKAVVMASGGWVNRRIVSDLPTAQAEAYGEFFYGPILTANVALRNWRFFDRLGFTNARWFEGLGWQVCVRRNVAFGDPRPLTPDDPIVLTFYIPFLSPQLPASEQGPAGRARLLTTSYAEFEQQIRTQMTEMFGPAGFDARRDIAGIVLNRWGHAYCAPQPGFFFGRDGAAPPSTVLRRPHGRIVFAHSELQGSMNMAYSMLEAHRGIGQAMTML